MVWFIPGSNTVYNVSTVLVTLCNIMAIKMTSSSSVLSALAAAPSAIPSAAGDDRVTMTVI